MNRVLLKLSLGLFLAIACASVARADVQPAAVDQYAKVDWSKVVADPFDGTIVYDKNFSDEYAYVSSWSRSGIRFTYTRYWKEQTGYKTVWRTRQVTINGKKRDETYPEQDPVYETRSRSQAPEKILLAINGQVYPYEGGNVSPELASALANAPVANVRVRLQFANGQTKDTEIGKATVTAWKSIFR